MNIPTNKWFVPEFFIVHLLTKGMSVVYWPEVTKVELWSKVMLRVILNHNTWKL